MRGKDGGVGTGQMKESLEGPANRQVAYGRQNAKADTDGTAAQQEDRDRDTSGRCVMLDIIIKYFDVDSFAGRVNK